MKRINLYLFVTMAMLMLSVSTAWAGSAYVKVTAEDGIVSWVRINGTINDTNIEIYKGEWVSAIEINTKGSIDLNEVWSESGGIGTHYQVTCIREYAFSHCSSLTSITIPFSVTRIGKYAFYYCSGLNSVTSCITEVFETGVSAFNYCDNASLYVPKGLVNTYKSTKDWNRFSKIEEIPGIALSMSCNNKGKVLVNGGVQFTNDMGDVSVYDGTDNTFVFTPEENCQLEQVLIDGLDVTLSVKNNQLTIKIHEGSKMIVTFSKSSGDMNGDGMVNISDVVKLVNVILGQ